MAVYQFSALSDGQAISFNPNADVLNFDQSVIAAADLRVAIDVAVDNDTINAFTGHDTLVGGGGDDWLVGDGWSDTLNGGAGRRQLRLGRGRARTRGTRWWTSPQARTSSCLAFPRRGRGDVRAGCRRSTDLRHEHW